MKHDRKEIEEKANKIVKLAEEKGVQENFFFKTTFNKYLTQIKVLYDLEEILNESETLVTKEYVKGRKNVYTNPAITEYNRTTDSANKTVVTLMKIVNGFGANDRKPKNDPLMEIINGNGNDRN